MTCGTIRNIFSIYVIIVLGGERRAFEKQFLEIVENSSHLVKERNFQIQKAQ